MAARRRSSRPEGPPRTLVVSCPDWPVTAAGNGPRALVAVVAAEQVVAASLVAREFGVRPGQRRRAAEARCPGLVVVPRDEGAELRAFEEVVRALESFGPPVALRFAGEAAIRLRGPSRYFGGEVAFVGLVAERLAGLLGRSEDPSAPAHVGSTWRLGVADGAFAAALAAGIGEIVPPGGSADFLSVLPVESLADPELADLLRRLGIPTLGAFAALAESDVLARFGRHGSHLQRLARGLEEEALSFAGAPRRFCAERSCDPPLERLDEATFVMRALAADLGGELAASGLACSLLEVAAEFSDGETVVRRWQHDGAFGAGLVAERLRFQLEVFLQHRPPEGEVAEGRGITALRLEAVEVVADLGRRQELWGRPAWSDERVGRTFSRLQGIVGPEGVQRPVVAGGRGPSERVRLVPFGDAPPEPGPAEAPWPGHLPPPSPALVPEEALSAEVLDEHGEALQVSARGVASGAPATVVLDGVAHEVGRWGGPWPAEEHWWEPSRRRRRARIQVVLDDGQAYLLALDRGRWLVEGRYD